MAIARALIILVLSTVSGAMLAIVTAPFWGWFEAKTGIESLGHSGPAGWVYTFCWLVCVAAGFAIFWRWPRHEN